MYSAGQFSKAASKADYRKESNAATALKDYKQGSGGGARRAAQQNRVKHRQEFEMHVGASPHPIKPAPRVTSHHSGSSISQQQQPTSNRRRRTGSGRGAVYICLGLLGGFFTVTGALLMAFGFTSDEFSWTQLSVGMILAYCGIGITLVGLCFLFICIAICCSDRRRKKDADEESFEVSNDCEQKMIGKQNNTRGYPRENGRHGADNKNGKSSIPDGAQQSDRKNIDGRPLPKTPSYTGSYTTT